jgi:hypothetical protein
MAAAWLSSRHWYYYLFSLEAYCIEYGLFHKFINNFSYFLCPGF